jgi:hypothetical protein
MKDLESLTIEKLGPIAGTVTVEPRPLTILIGEQASGKSLVAQVLYFFRALPGLLSRVYTPELVAERKWHDKAVRTLLDNLRGVPFGYFAQGTATLRYQQGRKNWQISVYQTNRVAHADRGLVSQMNKWVLEWSGEKQALGRAWISNQLFIPTERSVFTRLAGQAPTVLYAEHQPQPLRHFAEFLEAARAIYQQVYRRKRLPEQLKFVPDRASEITDFVLQRQKDALAGEAYVPARGPKVWKWRVKKGGRLTAIPIEATASGQMEAWPFFVIAATFGAFGKNMDFYFEEPETHLHPRAQVEVMKTIAYLVNQGQRFVVTTHSPFLLYVVNNLIQRFLVAEQGKTKPSGLTLNPNDVAAYRLGQPTEEILDRGGTNLLRLDELERVADELGGEFDRLLEWME